jgi:hypothetical protein
LGWRESERPFQPTASSPLDFATRVMVGLTVVVAVFTVALFFRG